MSIGINELYEMLNCNNTEEMQKKGIEEGKKIKYLSVLIRPIEDKEAWENCAKIIYQKSDEVLAEYGFWIFEWLQDENWPGYDIIYNRLKSMSVKLLKTAYSYSIKKATKLEDKRWLKNLAKLAENHELYNSLGQNEKNVILQYLTVNYNHNKN